MISALISTLKFILVLIITFSFFDYIAARVFPELRNKSEVLFHAKTFFEPKPYVSHAGSSDPLLQKNSNLNSLGYYGNVPSLNKPSHEYRIIFLGGSTVLFSNPSLAVGVEELFRQKNFSQVKTYNFGVAASNTRMDLARFIFEAIDYSPDMLVFYGGGNDIGLPFQGDPRPSYPINFLLIEKNPLLSNSFSVDLIKHISALTLLQSNVLRHTFGEKIIDLSSGLSMLREKNNWMSEDWRKKIVYNYTGDIEKIHNLTSGIGIKSAFFFQPLVYYKKIASIEEKKIIDSHENILFHAKSSRSMIQHEFSQNPNLKKVLWKDLSSIFDQTEDHVFTDGVHILEAHQMLVSNHIFKTIYPIVVEGLPQ